MQSRVVRTCSSRSGEDFHRRSPRSGRRLCFRIPQFSERRRFPNFSMNTATHRLRHGFHAIDPLCGFTSGPPFALARVGCGFKTSHVALSCHASIVAVQRNVGSGLPKSSQSFPRSSFQKLGWPSGTAGALGAASDFVQRIRSCSKVSLSSFQTHSPH
jgi:hypothetical protein